MGKGLSDRRFWLGLVASGLALGVIPLLGLQRILDQPDLLSRVMTGAAIALGVMAVATGFTLVPRLRFAGQVALTLFVATAIAVVVWMDGARSREPVPLERPTQAEWAGAVVVIVTWAAVGLLVLGFSSLARQARGRGHRGWIEELGQAAGYVAVCDCGWRGKVVRGSSAAFAAAGDHANKVEITIRRSRATLG